MEKRSLADLVGERREMIRVIREAYHLDSPKVLSIMSSIPREKFTPESYCLNAYSDGPISIGHGQTMSQPFTVAKMTHLATEIQMTNSKFPNKSQITLLRQGFGGQANHKLRGIIKKRRVLEIGTGSGYQAAILSKLVKEVYSIEIIPELAKKAKENLKNLGIRNVYIKAGNGEWGWPEKAGFDAIMITAGIRDKVPKALFDQLKTGGVLVAPIGKGKDKIMTRFRKSFSGQARYKKEEFGIFHFVPFVEEKN